MQPSADMLDRMFLKIKEGKENKMKGFPKVLKTAQDVRNCKAMVTAGKLKPADLLEAIAAIESQNFIKCPIMEVSSDRKTITVGYCYEAAAGGKASAGAITTTIQNVAHLDGEPDTEGKTQKEKTMIELSRAIAAGSEFLYIVNAPSVYETLDISEEELEQIKADLTAEA